MEFYGMNNDGCESASVAWCAPPPGLRSAAERREKELITLVNLGIEPRRLEDVKVSKHIDDIIETFDNFERRAFENTENLKILRTSGTGRLEPKVYTEQTIAKLILDFNEKKEKQRVLRQSFIDELAVSRYLDRAEHSVDENIQALATVIDDEQIVHLRGIFGDKLWVHENKVYYGDSKIRITFDGNSVRAYPTMMDLSLGNRGDIIGLLKRYPKTQIAVTHRVLENKVEQFVDMIGKSTVQFDSDNCGFNIKVQVPGEDPKFVCLIDAMNYDKLGIAALFFILLLFLGVSGYMTMTKTRIKLHNNNDRVLLVEKGGIDESDGILDKVIIYDGGNGISIDDKD